MAPNIIFNAVVAVGFSGIAVMNLDERYAPGFFSPHNCDHIQTEIEDVGACEWMEYLVDKYPEPGVDRIAGACCYDEDSSDYSDVSLAKVLGV